MAVWDTIKNLGIKHCDFHNPLFQEGNKVCDPLRKVPFVYVDKEIDSSQVVNCSEVLCQATFSSSQEYAKHQQPAHSHTCITCRQSFPSFHFLDLHVLECHDTLFELMAQKKNMYRCLLESCTSTFAGSDDRKKHCIEVHSFSPDFRFYLKQRRGKKINKNSEKMEVDGNLDTNKKSKKTEALSDISFGMGSCLAFKSNKSRHWPKQKQLKHNIRVNVEEMRTDDLMEALESV